jgi:hypothetical protein
VRLRVPLVLGVMHMAWGSGFLSSPRKLHRPRGNPARSAEKEVAGEAATLSGRE